MNLMRIRGTLLLLAFLGLTGGCGMRFAPGFSMDNKEYFMEPPYIASTPEGYDLRWRYGDMGFFYIPSSKVVDGRLLFSLQATSSSGNLTGQYGNFPITCERCIHALEKGGAYWVEPDGRQVRLEVRRAMSAPHTK